MLYAVYVSIHVLASILAVGLVGAVPLTARIARRSGNLAVFERILRALLLVMQVGLLIMLLSGAALSQFAIETRD